MMGATKLSEIKKELHKAARENAKDLKAWIKQQRDQGKGSRHSRVFEELVWLEHLLQQAASEKKRPACKSKRPAKKAVKMR